MSQEKGIERARQMLVCICDCLVDVGGAVDVKVSKSEKEILFQLFADSEDVGKLVGKQGRTARAIRTLLSGTGRKEKMVFTLDIPSGEIL